MTFDPLSQAGAKARGKRPWFLENQDAERVLNIVMALVQETAVMRQRLDTVERLLEARGVISQGDIEAYEPTKTEAEARGAWNQEFIARILRIVQQENEAVTRPDEVSSEDAAREFQEH
jgi:gamma-glutamyl phosphate reductase